MLNSLVDNKNKEKKENKEKIVKVDFQTKYTKKYFEIKRKELEKIFSNIKSDLQELADFFSPNSVRFLARNVNKPRVKSKKILDSTPLIAVRNFASGMMTGATSPARRWFKTGIMNKDIENTYEVKDWCARQAELTRKILNASNFYQVLPTVYKQLGIFLFSCISLEPDYNNVVNFKVLPIGSYFYSKNSKGDVDTIARNFMMSARNIVEEFGIENVSQGIKDCFEQQSEKLFEIVHFVEPNKDYIKGSKVSSQKKYCSVYYEVGSDEKFLSKSGFDKFPYVIFESSCNGEDNYPSDGPGAYALPDCKQLMVMIKEYAKAVKKIVQPAYQGPASLKNKGFADIPGAYNETDENGNRITPIYEVNPRVLEIKEIINELKNSIKSSFYNDLFSMILNTAERGRTATEVNELKEEKMVLLSPLLEQIHKSLKQILDWIFLEEIDKGIIPPYPEALEGQEIETEFISTLAQAMKAQNIASMERFTTFVANIGSAIDPVLLQKIKGEKIIDDYADFANIDPSQIRPTEEVEQYRAQMQQKQAQQEQIAALTQGTNMIKNMGGVDAIGQNLMSRVGLG